mmetsp:Transcript_41704/g.94146  ORF Transcript_41704/g.94146 Transcript_41704/m.94146 type:complete len:405 (+) Transcript_41704:48-1262(+)
MDAKAETATEPLTLRRIVFIAVACSAFMVVGPMLILVNKLILSGRSGHDDGFPYPIMLSSMGLGASSVAARVLVHALGWASISDSTRAAVGGPLKWMKTIAPAGVLMAVALGTGNASYLYLGVGMIQILKSSTPVLVLSGLVLSGVEAPSRPVILSVLLITVGTVLTVGPGGGGDAMSAYGLALFFLSSSAEATRLVMTQRLLTNVSFTVTEGQYYLSPPGFACLALCALFLEVPDALSSGRLANALLHQGPMFLLSTLLGIIVNFLGYFVIQTAGSLTMKILGTLRNVALVAYAVVVLGEIVLPREALGYLVTLFGFAGYSTFFRPSGASKKEERDPGSAGASHGTTKPLLPSHSPKAHQSFQSGREGSDFRYGEGAQAEASSGPSARGNGGREKGLQQRGGS